MNIDELSAWGVSQQIAQIVEQGFSYDEETGEIFFTTDDLDALEIKLEDKMSSLTGLYKKFSATAETLKNRSKEIAEKSNRFETKAENIKKYIDHLMQLNNKTKMDAGDNTISYRSSVSSEVFDEEALREYINSDKDLADKYFKIKKPDINKKAIGDDIKATKQADGTYTLNIPGFKLVENRNLQIK